jgi:hypothetical protein
MPPNDTKYLTIWLFRAYCKLYAKYKLTAFSYQNAKETIGPLKSKAEDVLLRKILSDLKRKGWLQSGRSDEDKREKQYTLNDPIKTFLKLFDKNQ